MTARTDSSAHGEIRLAVGFYNYTDLRALEEGIAGSSIRIVAAQQDAQRVYNDALTFEADAVLLCPDVNGYRHALIQDLLLRAEGPIPVIAWVEATSDDGRAMAANGAKGMVTLPMTSGQVTKFMSLLPQVIADTRQEREEGRIALGTAVPASRQHTWQQKVVTVYVPKGGGSTRTTLAVNLATALSHASLGNQPTALVDLDMSKGDCHTFLGYTVDQAEAVAKGHLLLDRGLFDLVINVMERWSQGSENLISPVLLRQFMVRWGNNSQLDLLPGLTMPHQGGAPEFQQWDVLLVAARRIIRELARIYSFVVVDIGQDFNLPFHRAAIEEADDVLVTVPPSRPAVVDTAHALGPLKAHFGNLNKFKLVIAAYDPSFGLTEREMVDVVRLPKLTTIPHDALTAATSINTCTPYVLTDEGPLGEAVRALAANYLPALRDNERSGGIAGFFRGFKRVLVKEA